MAEKTIGDLKWQSREVAPLPLRRNPPQQPLHVDSICDWDSGEVQALSALPHPSQSPLLPISPKLQPQLASAPSSTHPLCPFLCLLLPLTQLHPLPSPVPLISPLSLL
jgi:envoplakin